MARTCSVHLILLVALLLPSTVLAGPRPQNPQDRARVASVLANASNREQLTHFVGKAAERCVQASKRSELCQWNMSNHEDGWKALSQAIDTKDRVALVCELPTDGGLRAKDSCSAHPMRTNRDMFYIRTHGTGGKRPEGGATVSRKRAEYKKITGNWIKHARTLEEMSRVMGAAPDSCVPTRNTYLNCRWKASSRMYGHGTLAAWIEASTRKRIRLDCVFPLSGGPRDQVCLAEVGS